MAAFVILVRGNYSRGYEESNTKTSVIKNNQLDPWSAYHASSSSSYPLVKVFEMSESMIFRLKIINFGM